MATEIERKFLVKNLDFVANATQIYHIAQGYLKSQSPTVRLRIMGEQAFITIKGESSEDGLYRNEWEYPIPLEDAEAMMSLCVCQPISKDRYIIPQGDLCWEVDIFHGRHEGLILAEIELPETTTEIALPHWIGKEVTGDIRYYNATLAQDQ